MREKKLEEAGRSWALEVPLETPVARTGAGERKRTKL